MNLYYRVFVDESNIEPVSCLGQNIISLHRKVCEMSCGTENSCRYAITPEFAPAHPNDLHNHPPHQFPPRLKTVPR